MRDEAMRDEAMRINGRQAARRLAVFAVVLLLGGWPWPGRAAAFASAHGATMNWLLLDGATFGTGGHARLGPIAAVTSGPRDNVTADAQLLLSVDGYEGRLTLGLSLRRDAYLPLLIVGALLVAAPGPARMKAKKLLVGLLVVFAYSAAALYLLVLWTFAARVRGVYDASSFWIGALDLGARTLLLPPGNRFLIPLAVGFGLGWWSDRTSARR
jgi:hypothetical protein